MDFSRNGGRYVHIKRFAQADLVREAYTTAVKEEYRFLSDGDAMLTR